MVLLKDVEGHLLNWPRAHARAHSPLRKQMLAALSPVYFFQGKTNDVVLVMAGIHGSELCGIEVANWLRVKLEDEQTSRGTVPFFTTFIVPEVFKLQAETGRRSNTLRIWPGDEGDQGRNISDPSGPPIQTNRSCPLPGDPCSQLLRRGSRRDGYWALDKDSNPTWHLRDELVALMLLIEAVQPRRLASLHGIHLYEPVRSALKSGRRITQVEERRALESEKDFPGVYVDPRYTFSREAAQKHAWNLDNLKFSKGLDPAYPKTLPPAPEVKTTFSALNDKRGVEDDDLCLQIAQRVALEAEAISPREARVPVVWSRYSPYLVIGNHLGLDLPTVHYKFQKTPETVGRFSFGDWVPIDVPQDNNGYLGLDGKRSGLPVYTVEPCGLAESGAFRRSAAGFDQLLDQKGNVLDPKSAPALFDPTRCMQLHAYANALRVVLLEEYKPSVEFMQWRSPIFFAG